ncbi:hypothetical protein BDN67DRAFT_1017937 [Paxillus ammoniavirescens]|nr:hypothetical protein BDN67DRAFT_1017937 [Paxillus ammoniavirescens]
MCLRVLGSALQNGTVQHVLFPLNINDVHWAAIEINVVNKTISYADSLGWNWPADDIDTICRWLSNHGLTGFSKSHALQCGEQLDAFSGSIAAVNTIRHALFCDPLFTDNEALNLRMAKFLNIVLDHSKVSDHASTGSDSNAMDFDFKDNIELMETTLHMGCQVSIATAPLSQPTPSTSHKTHTHESTKSPGHGLLKFFPRVSHDERLSQSWKPFSWELRNLQSQEHPPASASFDEFEKAMKSVDQKHTVNTVLHDTPLPVPAMTTAEASQPHFQLQRHAHLTHHSNLGRKRK